MTRPTPSMFSNSVTQRLRALQNSIEQLPDPGTLWAWDDGLDAIGPSALEKLKAIDAVEKVGDQWWRVPPRIAAYVERVYDVEPSGSVGQDTLPVGRLVPDMDRVDESSLSSTVTRGRQVTLNGDPVTRDVHADDDDERIRPSEWPGQLNVSEAIELAAAS